MSGQNTSTAVMQRRRVAPDSLDYFPTPPFATRALCEFLRDLGYPLHAYDVWEPACGEFHMARPSGEYFAKVRASDVHPYGEHQVLDFPLLGRSEHGADWVITNPPFMLAEQFIRTALDVAGTGVAMLVRSAFLEGEKRCLGLFAETAPSYVLQFSERVVMLKDRLVRSGRVDPFHEKPGSKASSATSYSWLVWLHRVERDTRLRWIAPCRHRLERDGDYPIYSPAAVSSPSGGLFSEVTV